MDLDIDMNTDFEVNSIYQEGIISECYQRPDHLYVQDAPELGNLVDTNMLIPKFLPQEIDIEKILSIIQRKVLKSTHLPVTVKKIQAGYLTSPYFKDFIYIWLRINYLVKGMLYIR